MASITKKLQVRPHNIVDVEDSGGAEQGTELVEEHQHDNVQSGEEVEPWMETWKNGEGAEPEGDP